jgi:hypothetical protein
VAVVEGPLVIAAAAATALAFSANPRGSPKVKITTDRKDAIRLNEVVIFMWNLQLRYLKIMTSHALNFT